MKEIRLILTLLFALLAAPVVLSADEKPECELTDLETCETTKDVVIPLPLASPDQVENRLHIDSKQVTPLFPSSFARSYFDWKDSVNEKHDVDFGGDYSLAYLNASDSPRADDAFSGMYRFFGAWEASSDGKGNSGALIWKVEHRHAYGNNIPPGSLGFETGYIGLFLPSQGPRGDDTARNGWYIHCGWAVIAWIWPDLPRGARVNEIILFSTLNQAPKTKDVGLGVGGNGLQFFAEILLEIADVGR